MAHQSVCVVDTRPERGFGSSVVMLEPRDKSNDFFTVPSVALFIKVFHVALAVFDINIIAEFSQMLHEDFDPVCFAEDCVVVLCEGFAVLLDLLVVNTPEELKGSTGRLGAGVCEVELDAVPEALKGVTVWVELGDRNLFLAGSGPCPLVPVACIM